MNAVGCKCFFHYKWSDAKVYLFNYNKNHLNHPETKAYWETHPNQRKVKDADQIAAEKMFQLKVPFRNLKIVDELSKLLCVSGQKEFNHNLDFFKRHPYCIEMIL